MRKVIDIVAGLILVAIVTPVFLSSLIDRSILTSLPSEDVLLIKISCLILITAGYRAVSYAKPLTFLERINKFKNEYGRITLTTALGVSINWALISAFIHFTKSIDLLKHGVVTIDLTSVSNVFDAVPQNAFLSDFTMVIGLGSFSLLLQILSMLLILKFILKVVWKNTITDLLKPQKIKVEKTQANPQ